MIRVPAVDAHVHVDQVGEGDDAGGEEPGPVNVVVHVGGVQPGQQGIDHPTWRYPSPESFNVRYPVSSVQRQKVEVKVMNEPRE